MELRLCEPPFVRTGLPSMEDLCMIWRCSVRSEIAIEMWELTTTPQAFAAW